MCALITGRRTKYLILALWLVIAVVTAGFAGKLASVQRSDPTSSLPAGAESTRVGTIQSTFGSSDTMAAVVVYERAGGLTDADRAKVGAEARSFAGRADLGGAVAGPAFSADNRAARIAEEAARVGTRPATLRGLAATGAVITSAGLVLAGTFSVLATIPLTVEVELGFAVAFGILVDTFVVRSVLVTALSLDVGRYLWWPSRLLRTADAAWPPRAPGSVRPEAGLSTVGAGGRAE